jgi:hypothetical protein
MAGLCTAHDGPSSQAVSVIPPAHTPAPTGILQGRQLAAGPGAHLWTPWRARAAYTTCCGTGPYRGCRAAARWCPRAAGPGLCARCPLGSPAGQSTSLIWLGQVVFVQNAWREGWTPSAYSTARRLLSIPAQKLFTPASHKRTVIHNAGIHSQTTQVPVQCRAHTWSCMISYTVPHMRSH